MSSTIYKATPGDTRFCIDEIKPDTHFMGHDVKSLEVDTKSFGTLHLREVDSLKEITVKNIGLTLVFSCFPKHSIIVTGPIEEVRIQHNNKQYSLHRYASNPTLPFDEINSLQISNTKDFISQEVDALILFTDETDDISIRGSHSHIVVIGDPTAKNLQIGGQGVIRSLNIYDCSEINSIKIDKRVLSCRINQCYGLKSLKGFGDRLSVKPKPKDVSAVGIGGFWHEAPEWYELKVAMLQIKHFEADISPSEIRSCLDMGGIKLTPHSYDGPGGLCAFSEKLGLSIDEVSQGVCVSKMIDLILQDNKRYSVFQEWCDCQLSHFQQYIAMRILSSLISQGFDEKLILQTRKNILRLNINMPKLVTESVNDGYLGGKWNQLTSSNKDEWEVPNNAIMPFGRLDLEIWLNCDMGLDFITKQMEVESNQYSRGYRTHLGKSEFVRNLIVSILSAANKPGRSDGAERKINHLVEMLYTNPMINQDPYCCEFTILHLGVSKIVDSKIVGELIKGISSMQVESWVKVALLIGIIHQIDSPKARLALRRISSDKGFTVSQSNAINAVAVAGRRAFETGKVPYPKWPYVSNWNLKMRY